MASRPPKRRRLTPPPSDEDHSTGAASKKSSTKIQKSFFQNAAGWDLEQHYEAKSRKAKKREKKESSRLPIKTSEGLIQQQEHVPGDTASVDSDVEWLDGEGKADQQAAEQDAQAAEQPQLSEREQIFKAKEELAKIATQLNEDPEEHPGAFRALAKVGQTNVLAIQKLCLVTQLAVYKDVIPGYRIRPVTEEAMKDMLSKETRRVWTYEQSLVSGYQAYVRQLTRLGKAGHPGASSAARSLAIIAIDCACTLVTAVPHFNFRSDLLKILVGKLSRRNVDDGFVRCRKTLETLFREDEEGRPSMEAVSLLSKMMRARDYFVDESVVNLFLHLRLLSEFSGTASQDQVDMPDDEARKAKKLGKNKKEWRTKRERKQTKEQKAIDKDMAMADALVGHEERERMQSETLKLVFASYFRILKQRSPHLMGAVLEGLAKYSHLINQDFFGDLLEALKDLIRHSENDEEDPDADDGDAGEEDGDDDFSKVRNASREALLCTVTAFALLAGQDAHNARSDLHLDLSFFTTHLYRSLFSLSVNADLELGARSLHLPDPNDPAAQTRRDNKVNLQTTTVLLIRCLTAILLPSWNLRSVPPLRLASFAKQLMSTSLHMPEKSCQAVLALLNDVVHAHGKKIGALWNTEERKGDGTFNPFSDTVEGSNPFTATVWEGEILRKHFCPKVREGVKMMEKGLPN